jgi:uncharacterized protein YndB with AHSA1/START domain
MTDRNHYVFRSEWRIDAPPADVYAVLHELPDYPAWWPEVRTTEEVGEQAYRLTCRSTLPYDLVFVTTQARQDPEAGVLEANLAGDLDGFSRWTITASGTGSLAVFEEEVDATKPLLRRLAAVARPAFKANHSLMMRHGQAGLRTYVAGYRLGRRR